VWSLRLTKRFESDNECKPAHSTKVQAPKQCLAKRRVSELRGGFNSCSIIHRFAESHSEFGGSNLFAGFFILEKLYKTGRSTENPAFQIRSSRGQFCRVLRFRRLEKSISYVFSISLNIPTPPASTSFCFVLKDIICTDSPAYPLCTYGCRSSSDQVQRASAPVALPAPSATARNASL
jgi:hypothetical protein